LVYQENPDLTKFWEKIVFKKVVSEIPQLFHFASPIHHLSTRSPPCFILHGLPDNLVPSGIASEFVAAYRQITTDPRKIVYAKIPQAHHGFDLTFSVRTWAVDRAIADWITFWEIESNKLPLLPPPLPPQRQSEENQKELSKL